MFVESHFSGVSRAFLIFFPIYSICREFSSICCPILCFLFKCVKDCYMQCVLHYKFPIKSNFLDKFTSQHAFIYVILYLVFSTHSHNLCISILLGGMYIIDASGKALWKMQNTGVNSLLLSFASVLLFQFLAQC